MSTKTTIIPPKRRAPRLMGVATVNRRLGLTALDPWEIRGAANLNLRDSMEDLKLKVMGFATQEKPRVVVIEDKNNGSKFHKIISELIRLKNLDLVKVNRQDCFNYFHAVNPPQLRKRLAKVYSGSSEFLKTDEEILSASLALFALHTREFHSRTYVKPTPRNKTENTQRA